MVIAEKVTIEDNAAAIAKNRKGNQKVTCVCMTLSVLRTKMAGFRAREINGAVCIGHHATFVGRHALAAEGYSTYGYTCLKTCLDGMPDVTKQYRTTQ
jgi:hypothetical protein